MDTACDDLSKVLDDIPPYASWNVKALEESFVEFHHVISARLAQDRYCHFAWLSEVNKDLRIRIERMIAESSMETQANQFNSIVFEMKCAIEVMMGDLGCENQQEWLLLIDHKFLKAG